jgi:hypothetical protein
MNTMTYYCGGNLRGLIPTFSSKTECLALRKSLEAGAQPAFPPSVVVDVKRLACELPTHANRSARRVFWIADNCSSHRGDKAAGRLRAQWPTLTLVHTPVHASWLNQVEIYFSIIQRKVVTPHDFTSLLS